MATPRLPKIQRHKLLRQTFSDHEYATLIATLREQQTLGQRPLGAFVWVDKLGMRHVSGVPGDKTAMKLVFDLLPTRQQANASLKATLRASGELPTAHARQRYDLLKRYLEQMAAAHEPSIHLWVADRTVSGSSSVMPAFAQPLGRGWGLIEFTTTDLVLDAMELHLRVEACLRDTLNKDHMPRLKAIKRQRIVVKIRMEDGRIVPVADRKRRTRHVKVSSRTVQG